MDSEKCHYFVQNIETSSVFKRWPLSFLASISIGFILGITILFMGGLPYKWIFVISSAACFPLFAAAIGSVKRALETLLILSFGMLVDVNIGFTDKYSDRIWGTPITFTFVLLVCLYILWAWRVLDRNEKVSLFPIVTVPFFILILWSGVSVYWAKKPDYTIYNLWGMLEMFLLLLYTANFVKSESDIRFVIKCIAITIGINGVVAIIQYTTGSFLGLEFLGTASRDEIEKQTFAHLGIFRVSGLLDNANSFAWFMKVWLPLLLLWAVGGIDRIFRYLCLLSFVLGLVALVLTFSRGGWLAFSFSILVVVILLLTNRRHTILHWVGARFLLVGLIASLVILPFIPVIKNRLNHEDYGAAYSRIPMAQVALNIIRHHPIKGVGLGNYRYVMHKYDNTPENIATEFPHPVHNIYLLLAAELGIGALALFIFISIVVFYCGFRTLGLSNAATILFILGLIGGLAGFYLHGMVEQGIIGFGNFARYGS